MWISSTDRNLKAVKERQIKGNLQGQAAKIAEDMKCGAVIHSPFGKRKRKGVFFCIRKVVCN